MIETPSAALKVDHLARECDFVSIGTNDLIQYIFAADRENQEVRQPLSPAAPCRSALAPAGKDHGPAQTSEPTTRAGRCRRPAVTVAAASK
jgi:phosphoenolpyruvate synthase/pyruvate phosphate dikinase